MKKLLGLAALGFLLSAFVVLAAVPARAESMDDKIQVLEQELARLKAEQARATREQMEIKKEATAAAAALPTFTYRPGRGVTIGAADRAWSFETNYELMVVMYNHLEGNDRRGATTGDLHFRRNRPMWVFNFNNDFYEWGIALDMDTANQITQQNQWWKVRFQQMNPYFPEFQLGDNTSGPYGGTLSMAPADRSSHSSGILESLFDMLSDSDSQRLGRRAMHLIWRNMPVGQGDFSFSAEYKMGAGVAGSFGNTQTSDTDRKQLATQLHVRPFSRSKNFWTEGIVTGVTLETDSVDTRSSARGRRLRVQSGFERIGGQTILDTRGSGTTETIGGGNHNHWTTGLGWRLGPYWIAVQGEWVNYEDKAEPGITSLKGPGGNAWRIWHELFLWSPKGPFTGSAATPGSVQAGWAFARSQADCGKGVNCNPSGTAYNSVHLLNRELGLYYYLRSQMRVGVNWYWWTSSNTPTGVQQAIGCTTRPAAANSGKECDWHTLNLVLNANF